MWRPAVGEKGRLKVELYFFNYTRQRKCLSGKLGIQCIVKRTKMVLVIRFYFRSFALKNMKKGYVVGSVEG